LGVALGEAKRSLSDLAEAFTSDDEGLVSDDVDPRDDEDDDPRVWEQHA